MPELLLGQSLSVCHHEAGKLSPKPGYKVVPHTLHFVGKCSTPELSSLLKDLEESIDGFILYFDCEILCSNFFIIIFSAPGSKSRALYMLGEHHTTELHQGTSFPHRIVFRSPASCHVHFVA